MNLASVIDGHDADAVALISRHRPTTYGELTAQVDHLRGGLASVGVRPGDRVALLCGNSRHFVISYLSVLGLGAVVVALNPIAPARAIEAELAAVGATTVVIEKLSTARWNNVDRTQIPTLTTVVTCDATTAPPDAIPIDDLLAVEPVPRLEVEADHLAVLIFTSGTAGAPRAAMLSHGNLLANVEQVLSTGDHVTADDTVYTVIPLFHIFGLNVALGLSLSVGATVLLVQRFDPVSAIESIVERGVTVLPGPPSMWAAFTHLDDTSGDEFASVRLAISGASRLPNSVAIAMRDRFGVSVCEGYGLTEASPTVTSSIGVPIKIGSVGRVVSGVQVRLVNDDGDIPAGDVGEVWVRGRNVFAGYFGDQEATDMVLTSDGWLKTGDMATLDDDGFVYLVDRAKDLVIVSGFNVFPAEVEEVLELHPCVAGAGVIGVPHPHTGEAVKAFVVVESGADVDEESLVEFCRDRLARYKCPNKIMFVDTLPRNGNDKLVRRRLE